MQSYLESRTQVLRVSNSVIGNVLVMKGFARIWPRTRLFFNYSREAIAEAIMAFSWLFSFIVVIAVAQCCDSQVIMAEYRRLLPFLTGTLVTFVSQQ